MIIKVEFKELCIYEEKKSFLYLWRDTIFS